MKTPTSTTPKAAPSLKGSVVPKSGSKKPAEAHIYRSESRARRCVSVKKDDIVGILFMLALPCPERRSKIDLVF